MSQETKAQLTCSNSEIVRLMTYPADTPITLGGTNWLFGTLNLDWQAPEDAIEMVHVKNRDAYFIRGSWSAEVLKVLTELDEEKLHSMTPDWDYEYRKSMYFEFELSDGVIVNVSLAAMYNAELISREEMIRIAESCVQVE